MQVTNFGRNVSFEPKRVYAPRTEAELLSILADHAEGKIRVVASRHAWSNAIVSEDALVDMRLFRAVRLFQEDGRTCVRVGAGCQIKHLLAFLNRRGLTTPSVGLITEQTIAGAMSTGTHGSGKHSLSHYIRSIRLACYDAQGNAMIRKVSEGDELRAARCSLGCLGVIVSVTLECVPQYFVTEKATPVDTVEEVLALEDQAPLQQFFLVPHLWRYYAYERRVADVAKPSPLAGVYRLYWFVIIDLALHVLIKLFAVFLRSRRLVRVLFRHLLPSLIFPRWVVTDRSDRILVMEHELFRHMEIEIFVPKSRVVEAARFVEVVLMAGDGQRESQLSEATSRALEDSGLFEMVRSFRGRYQHHYPVCFRRVLADDTLISMTAGDEEWWYAISFITYVTPRDEFCELARLLAASMPVLFDARLHWGKWFPLAGEDVADRYSRWREFREICERFDPRGVFRNAFVTDVFGWERNPRNPV